jgi:hypothetical protein
VSYVADEATLNSVNFTNFSLVKDQSYYINTLGLWVHMKNLSENTRRRFFKNARSYPVVIGRGCRNSCYYCGGSKHAQQVISGRKSITIRSVDSVISSIRDVEAFGFDAVMMNYDPLPSGEAENFYFRLFEEIQRLDIKLSFEIERWTLPTPEFIERFRQSLPPDSVIDISINSHSEELRRKSNLYFFSNQELEQCLTEMDRQGVRCLLFFACGLPFESRQDLIEMEKYQRKLSKKFGLLDIKTYSIEIEPCSDLSLHGEKYEATPLRKSFVDYYRYHADGRKNHYQALGYVRKECLNNRALNRLICSRFCGKFKRRYLSLLLCNVAALAWRCGIVGLIDRLFARNSSASTCR